MNNDSMKKAALALLDCAIGKKMQHSAEGIDAAVTWLEAALTHLGEPVAWIYQERYGKNDDAWIERINRTLPVWETRNAIPLYAAAPKGC